MLLVIAVQFPAVGQVLSTTNATNSPSSAVSLDVKVLAVPGSGLRELGLFFPDGGAGEPVRPGGFAIVLREGEAEALAKDPETVAIHSLRLPPKADAPAKFRVEARTPITEAYPVNPPYFEVALGFEVTSKTVSQRNVALSTVSVVQIRRGPGEPRSAAALLLETQPIKHDVQVPEGKTILLGGFFTASDSARLPDIPPTPESPMLHYVLSKGPRGTGHPEIVVLLTPRLVESPGGVRIPVITEAMPSPGPPQSVQTAPAVAASQSSEPKPLDLKPVISALVTTPEVVAPPISPMVTVRPAPPIAKLAPVPLAKRDARPSYSVQVGAFRSSEKADSLMGKLQKQFDEVFVEETPGAVTPYRVRIGPLPTLAVAKQIRQRLTQRGIESFVVLPASR
jgi:cell division septation protein DedD